MTSGEKLEVVRGERAYTVNPLLRHHGFELDDIAEGSPKSICIKIYKGEEELGEKW